MQNICISYEPGDNIPRILEKSTFKNPQILEAWVFCKNLYVICMSYEDFDKSSDVSIFGKILICEDFVHVS